VKMSMNDTLEGNDGDDDDERDEKKISRKKTPMPRARKLKAVTAEELDENGIIDRDEDLYDDNDDVSTSTLRGSEESLEAYISEENKINELNRSNGGSHVSSERFRRVKKFMSEMKDKGKGLSCKNADTVIDEHHHHQQESNAVKDNHKKSCAIM
jgi:hypothetical protein